MEVWKIIFLSKWLMAVGSMLIFQGVFVRCFPVGFPTIFPSKTQGQAHERMCRLWRCGQVIDTDKGQPERWDDFPIGVFHPGAVGARRDTFPAKIWHMYEFWRRVMEKKVVEPELFERLMLILGCIHVKIDGNKLVGGFQKGHAFQFYCF